MTPIIKLSGVERVFPGAADPVLRDISIEIQLGELVAITGPSGAGKSTLLNILGLLDSPSSGDYALDGRETSNSLESERDRLRSMAIGFVFQSSHVLPYETVEHNAAMALSIQAVPMPERRRLVREALARVGLTHRRTALARTLSGGERQRLAIARVLTARPPIVLADEPTGNLDSYNGEVVLELLRQLNADGSTVIVVTHDQTIAARVPRQITLVDGRIVDDSGTPGLPRMKAPIVPNVSSGRASRWLEIVVDAIATLTSRPARTAALTMAFTIGIAGVVAATGVGASASQQVSERLTASALDAVYVSNDAKSDARLAEQAARILALDHVQTVAHYAKLEASQVRVSRFSGQTASQQSATIVADAQYLGISEARTTPSESSELLGSVDSPINQHVALVGIDAARNLQIASPFGAQVWVAGVAYTVVGIIEEAGRDPSLSNSIVLPWGSSPHAASDTIVRTDNGFPAAVADAIPLAVAPEDPASVQVSTVADLRNLQRGVAEDLGTLILVVSSLLLIVAVASATISMYLAVQARTQEIGLRRALGRRRRDLFFMLLAEGSSIGLAGGLSGLAIGLAATVVVSWYLGWTAVMPWQMIVVGGGTGLVCGALSGLIPAARAASVEPAQAIR